MFSNRNRKGTVMDESSFHFRAFCLLYALGFPGLRVTGLSPPQAPRRCANCSCCFFFERFSNGMNFSISDSFL